MVKSILQYLGVRNSPNLHQLFILTRHTDATWWFVSWAYILNSSHYSEEIVYVMVPRWTPFTLHQLFFWTRCLYLVLDLHFMMDCCWSKWKLTGPLVMVAIVMIFGLVWEITFQWKGQLVLYKKDKYPKINGGPWINVSINRAHHYGDVLKLCTVRPKN